MTRFTKGFILGVFVGAIFMFAFVCGFGWWYEVNHPIEIEEIVVDSFPSDTSRYLGSYEGRTVRK